MDQPAGVIASYLTTDHERLAAVLDRSERGRSVEIDRDAFAEFRRGLLRHIAIEEKILLPAASRARGGEPLPIAARLRLDHGALAALLVPTPTPAIVHALRFILARHNALEEGPDGLYATCERLAPARASALVAELRAAPEVPVAAHNDSPLAIPATRRALARAGYDPALIDDEHTTQHEETMP
jgi:hypothetical protein